MSYDNPNKENEQGDSGVDNTANQSNDRSYLSHIVEEMMAEMNITAYDPRTCHMLVDILQREAYSLLTASAEKSEKRLSTEREKLLCGNNSTATLTKPNMNVSEEDAQLACQEYINNNIVNPGILKDLIDVQKYANNVRLATKPFSTASKQRSLPSFRPEDEMGQFPSGQVPYLPENTALNTLLPHWDIELRETKQ